MGRGPAAILERGLADQLRSKQLEVHVTSIALPDTFQPEGSALVELQLQAARAVREAVSRDARPILLSGNCGPAALGATGALGSKTTGVIWFDAHADFNTPETSASGFLDGMALSILTGRCWPRLAARFESFQPVPMEHIIQIGVRNMDPEEAMQLEQTAITRISPKELSRVGDAIDKLAQRVPKVYVHVDTDVIDSAEGCANTYACPGGLMLQDLYHALEMIGASVRIGAGSITSYDPEADRDGRIGRAIPRLVELLAR